MVMQVASMVSAMRQEALSAQVGAKLMNMAKESVEMDEAALLQLLEAAQALELSLNPNLGTKVDIRC